MPEPVLTIEKAEGVATLVLNRPDSMNALSAELRLALGSAFAEIQEDPDIRVAIVTGAGRAFCAGMDLKELGSGGAGVSGFELAVAGQDEMRDGIDGFAGPVIAAVNGVAATAGFELALACDLIVASTEARFIDSHARVGILPGWGLSVRLPRLIGVARAKEISLTGGSIDAAQAYEWGLVNRVVPPEELLPACRDIASRVVACPPGLPEGYKRLIDEGSRLPLDKAMVREREAGTQSSKEITSETIADRRTNVMERGRKE